MEAVWKRVMKVFMMWLEVRRNGQGNSIKELNIVICLVDHCRLSGHAKKETITT